MITPLNSSEFQPKPVAQPVVTPQPEPEQISVVKTQKINHATAKEGENQFANDSRMTKGEQEQVRDLKNIERQVRNHEQAHKQTGGKLAGQVKYRFTAGPDGKHYITGGSTPIDISKIANNPQGTIDKMEQVIKAAMAPQQPSQEDYRVAALAKQIIMESRVELQKQKKTEEDKKETQFHSEESDEPEEDQALPESSYYENIYKHTNPETDPSVLSSFSYVI